MIKPVSLSPVQKSPVIDVESSMSSSDNAIPVFGSSRGDKMEPDTGDSKATAIGSKVSELTRVLNSLWFLKNPLSKYVGFIDYTNGPHQMTCFYFLNVLLDCWCVITAFDWPGHWEISTPGRVFCKC